MPTEIGNLGVSSRCEGLALNAQQVLYAACEDGLYTVDTNSGLATLVGANSYATNVGLAFDEDGTLWMTSGADGILRKLDPKTGAATDVGALGATIIDSIAWDGSTLYGLNRNDQSLYLIDRVTGAATLIAPVVGPLLDQGSGLTTDTLGRLWGTAAYFDQFTLDKATGEVTSYETREISLTGHFSVALNPFMDFDNDGIADFWEDLHGLASLDPLDAALDGEADGLTNLEEFLAGTDPDRADTDGDGYTDGDEVHVHGTDPLDPSSNPGAPPGVPTLEPSGLAMLVALLAASGLWAARRSGPPRRRLG